jgi:hypothetical protein
VKRRWYWKVYFFFLAAQMVLTIGFSLYYLEDATALDAIAEWAVFPLYAVQLLGLYGFIYWRRFANAMLWRLVFVASIVEAAQTSWVVYSMPDSLPDIPAFGSWIFLATALVVAVLIVPLLVGLFLYAYRSAALWATAS